LSFFRCLGCTKVSLQAWGKCSCFAMKQVFSMRIFQQLAQPLTCKTPQVGCLWLLIQYRHSYPPYLRPFSKCNMRTRHATMTETQLFQPLAHVSSWNAQGQLHIPQRHSKQIKLQ
jgi:hypothetical protein